MSPASLLRVLILFLVMASGAFAQDVRITEFLPVNTAGLKDEDLTFQPWIEIWNTNTAAKVTLTSWKLVHGASQWTFPATMEIPPGEYLVVFADSKNRTVMTAPLHTNFTLSSTGGGPLQLVRADTTIASTFPTYPALAANVSYGRDGAEIAQIGSYTNPTPGGANNYSGIGVSGNVLISLSSRAFTGTLSVDLSQVVPVAGATIRYTTNGTVPVSTSPAFTTGTPIAVTGTTLLRARVFESGKLPGETEAAGYLLLDGTTSAFNTAAPIVVVSNFNVPLPFTADATTDVLTVPNLSTTLGPPVTTGTRVKVASTGTLPGGLSASTDYYVRDLAGNALKLATTSGGTAVDVTSIGTGTHTMTAPIPDTGDQPAFLWVWEPAVADGRARFTNLPTLATRCAVDRRGSSTLTNAKTNFNLEARKDRDDLDKDVSLLGMPNGSDWVFHAPYNFDRSDLHNPFMYALSNSIGRQAMRTRMAEVFVETTGVALTYSGAASGDYFGLYNVMEKIRRGKDRVDVHKLDTYDNDAVGKTGGYIVKVDRKDAGDTGFTTPHEFPNTPTMTNGFAFYYPKEIEIRAPQRAPQLSYITSLCTTFDNVCFAANYADPITGYAAYLNVPAAVDHHLMQVWPMNVDGMRLSGFIQKERGGKIVYGPIWDYDRTMESTDARDDNPVTWRSTVSDFGTDFFNYTWWARLFSDPDFYQKYIDRWVELRRGPFSATTVNALLDTLNAQLTAEGVTRDLARWGQAKRTATFPNSPAGSYPGTQAGEVQRIKDWLQVRANFMDSQWVAPVTFSSGGGNIAPGLSLTMTAAAGSTIRYTLDGSEPRPSGGGAAGAGVLTYSAPITINATTRVKARAYNASWTALTGANNPPLVSKWSGLTNARFSTDTPASAANLAVTEVNFHPADPSAAELAVNPVFDTSSFEFIELKNIGAAAVDLEGVKVTLGVIFTFTNEGAFTLAPGQFVVIAANPAALTARYGAIANVVGPFTGDLNNGGEQITIKSASNATIADFTYDDLWYPTTDGGGRTLAIYNPTAPAPAFSTSANWRASAATGGSPGANEPNLAPIANAGLDLIGYLPSIAIAGATDDDTLPAAPLTIAWSQIAGPGTASFAPANAAATTASFDIPGVYALRLSANDGALSTPDDVSVAMRDTPGAWLLRHPGIGSLNDDPDGDGRTNWFEWTLGQDPSSGAGAGGIIIAIENDHLTLTCTRQKASPFVSYLVQVTGDLSAWADPLPGDVTEAILTDDGIVQTVKATDNAPAGAGRFIRLKVTPLP